MFVDSDGYDNVLYTTRFDDLILIQSRACRMNYEMRKSLSSHLNSKNHLEYLQPLRPALNPFEFPFEIDVPQGDHYVRLDIFIDIVHPAVFHHLLF